MTQHKARINAVLPALSQEASKQMEHCKVCGRTLTGDMGYVFSKGWWYCVAHASQRTMYRRNFT